MPRVAAVVRPAGADDLDATAGLWEELRGEEPNALRLPEVPALLAGMREHLAASAQAVAAGRDATCRLAVAYDAEGTPVGAAFVRVVDRGPFEVGGSVSLDVMHVTKACRRSVIGRLLLSDVASFAAGAGVEDLSVVVPSGDRDLNRFYAGWGFRPRTLRRGTAVPALARRLGIGPAAGKAGEATQVQRLLRRRALLGARSAR